MASFEDANARRQPTDAHRPSRSRSRSSRRRAEQDVGHLQTTAAPSATGIEPLQPAGRLFLHHHHESIIFDATSPALGDGATTSGDTHSIGSIYTTPTTRLRQPRSPAPSSAPAIRTMNVPITTYPAVVDTIQSRAAAGGGSPRICECQKADFR